MAARLAVLAPPQPQGNIAAITTPIRDERHVSCEPNTTGGCHQTRIDAPPGWPIWAQLPHAGRGSRAVETALSFCPSASLPVLGAGDDEPLSLYADHAERDENPALAMLNHRQTTRVRSGNVPAASPQLNVEAYQWPELDADSSKANRAPAPGREYLRLDAPDPRVGRRAQSSQTKNSLATRAYQWHSALGPHAGVAVTVALILSATLLYWLTLGQGRPAGDYEDILNQDHTWSSETTLESRIAVDQPGSNPPESSLGFPHPASAPPRIADAGAQPTISPTQPSDQTPVAAAEAPATNRAPGAVDEAAAVTPTPNTLPYPVTDYVSLDFAVLGAVEPAVATQPASAEAPFPQAAATPPAAAAN